VKWKIVGINERTKEPVHGTIEAPSRMVAEAEARKRGIIPTSVGRATEDTRPFETVRPAEPPPPPVADKPARGPVVSTSTNLSEIWTASRRDKNRAYLLRLQRRRDLQSDVTSGVFLGLWYFTYSAVIVLVLCLSVSRASGRNDAAIGPLDVYLVIGTGAIVTVALVRVILRGFTALRIRRSTPDLTPGPE